MKVDPSIAQRELVKIAAKLDGRGLGNEMNRAAHYLVRSILIFSERFAQPTPKESLSFLPPTLAEVYVHAEERGVIMLPYPLGAIAREFAEKKISEQEARSLLSNAEREYEMAFVEMKIDPRKNTVSYY
jgi:hypothetical protein